MADQNEKHQLVSRPPDIEPAGPGNVVRVLHLAHEEALDLTDLDPRQADALVAKAHEMAIERDDQRKRMKDDLQATAAKLGIYTEALETATDKNAAVTVTNTKDDSLGRTEMILGNSEAAHAGKLSRTQQGLGDNVRFWLVLSIIAGVVIVLVAALRR
jgi:hypothetical protein